MTSAAFAPYPGGIIATTLPDELPVVAVGGSNPDHSVLRRLGQGTDDEAVGHEREDTDYCAGGSE
jgi:hypothetical protein